MAMRATSARTTADTVIMTQVGCRLWPADSDVSNAPLPRLGACKYNNYTLKLRTVVQSQKVSACIAARCMPTRLWNMV